MRSTASIKLTTRSATPASRWSRAWLPSSPSLPPLVGATISTFKETSLLAIIGIIDFLRVANSVIPGQTQFLGVKMEGLLFVCLIYWIGAYSMSKFSQRLERHLGVGEH